MWFDSHTHLFECQPVGETAARARRAGVSGLLVAGVDEATSAAAVELAERPDAWAAVGIHPNSSAGFAPVWMEGIERLARSPNVVGIGETGLDFYREAAPRPDQEAAFAAHIDLAVACDKALVVHTRNSVTAALDMLEGSGRARVVFHCWSGDRDELERALALGAFVSFAGNVTFRSAGSLRELCAVVPEDRLLIETDSPYLAPEPHRGRPNEPAHVPLVGRAVAGARAEDPGRVAEVTARNARRVFGLAS